MPNIRDESRLLENAKAISSRVHIPKEVLEFLYAKSRWQAGSHEQWMLDVRTACAIDMILRTAFPRKRPANFTPLIDGAEALRAVPPGTLFLTFHGAFVRLARHLFAELVPSGLQVDKGFAGDSRGALFTALRSLQDGQSIFIAPDGPGGTSSGNIRIFDISIDIADGGAFLAHASRCSTVWFTVVRDGDRFATIIEQGPRCGDRESFASFKERFFDFYAEKIHDVFTGNPQNISLRPKWQDVLGERARRGDFAS